MDLSEMSKMRMQMRLIIQLIVLLLCHHPVTMMMMLCSHRFGVIMMFLKDPRRSEERCLADDHPTMHIDKEVPPCTIVCFTVIFYY
mmetsp:Transcript_21204/g.33327  ORF Transcript_21204/g.33327 Transcript_21204/m.33327 type:complete len:86 (+) Transcript_21204:291-548(+)